MSIMERDKNNLFGGRSNMKKNFKSKPIIVSVIAAVVLGAVAIVVKVIKGGK